MAVRRGWGVRSPRASSLSLEASLNYGRLLSNIAALEPVMRTGSIPRLNAGNEKRVMASEHVEFPVNGKSCKGYLAVPDEGAKGPGLLILQEWWGLVDHIREVTDRFAAAGFVALAPDLYHGDTTTSPDEAGRKMMALDIERAGKDLEAAVDYVVAHPACEPKNVAALGFCMGGQLALYAGTVHPQIAAVVDFYGIHPEVKPDFSKLSGPVLCHFGKNDEFVKEDTARDLIAQMEEAGADVQAHFYDAGHAFFNDSREEAYEPDAANQAWQRTIAFLATLARA